MTIFSAYYAIIIMQWKWLLEVLRDNLYEMSESKFCS